MPAETILCHSFHSSSGFNRLLYELISRRIGSPNIALSYQLARLHFAQLMTVSSACSSSALPVPASSHIPSPSQFSEVAQRLPYKHTAHSSSDQHSATISPSISALNRDGDLVKVCIQWYKPTTPTNPKPLELGYVASGHAPQQWRA